MSGILKSIGRGLLLTGLALLFLYFVGAHLRGPEALEATLDPFAIRTYLPVLLLTPGALLLWLADHIGGRRRQHQLMKTRTSGPSPRGGRAIYPKSQKPISSRRGSHYWEKLGAPGSSSATQTKQCGRSTTTTLSDIVETAPPNQV